MTIELRKPLNKLMNMGYGGRTDNNIFIFRVVSTIPMEQKLLKDVVTTHIKNEINILGQNSPKYAELLNGINSLKESPIVFFKEEKDIVPLNNRETEVFYTQFIVDGSSIIKNDNFFYNYLSCLYRSSGGNINPHAPLGDIVYQICEHSMANKNKTAMIISSNTELNSLASSKFDDIKNNIVLMSKVDLDKKYNRNSLVKIHIECYSSLVEAFKNKTKNTYSICCFNNKYPIFTFIIPKDRGNGNVMFSPCYTSNIYMDFYKDMIIFYDGEKAKHSVEPYLSRLNDLGIRMLDILQFSATKDLFFTEMYNDHEQLKKLVLHFINKNKLFPSRSSINVRSNIRLEGNILYLPKKNMKKKIANIKIDYINSFFGEAVIPVDDNNIQDRALNLVMECMEHNLRRENIVDIVKEYKKCMIDMETREDDVLSQWFEYCTRSIRNTDDRIVQAYVTMKNNLEKEYKEIGSYLNCYDFSKCMAIPKVSMDKKLKENYYKTLHIEPKSIIIKSINNKKINPIQEVQPTIRIMMANSGRRQSYFSWDFPLNKFLNIQTNTLDLCYNKMKGEVNRVKTQNRR